MKKFEFFSIPDWFFMSLVDDRRELTKDTIISWKLDYSKAIYMCGWIKIEG